ncbi:hypothetical protein ONE63_011438 [Megalurothrips usitatus]|uniref:Retrovirus-related Pol polyprotein from transposon TNT 1-94 n=1 Tax=Megalurothrips usitatus TaxID=439358 RepID=A0AAV7WZA6_9NEOP|nr:hypothetical protein ONE63_011438 [Megalurothrips usitatus]
MPPKKDDNYVYVNHGSGNLTINEKLGGADLDAKCMAKINVNLKPSVYPYVAACKTAKETWDALSKAFEDKGSTRTYAIQRQLFRIQFVDYRDMEDYLSNALKLNQLLSDLDHKVPDDLFANILLGGLPSAYDSLIMGIESSHVGKLTSEAVISRLRGLSKINTDTQEAAALASWQNHPTG